MDTRDGQKTTVHHPDSKVFISMVLVLYKFPLPANAAHAVSTSSTDTDAFFAQKDKPSHHGEHGPDGMG